VTPAFTRHSPQGAGSGRLEGDAPKLSIRNSLVLCFLLVRRESNNLGAAWRQTSPTGKTLCEPMGRKNVSAASRMNVSHSQNANLCRLEGGPTFCFLRLTGDSNSGMCRLELEGRDSRLEVWLVLAMNGFGPVTASTRHGGRRVRDAPKLSIRSWNVIDFASLR
jgi:hypothetical protein